MFYPNVMDHVASGTLIFPHAAPPLTAEVIEVAPGILWTRIPLPFRLDHVNIYLLEDEDGFAILDTGIGNAATQEVWEALVAGPLAGRRITKLIVSHFHPDHIGLAGWLCERFDVPMLTTQTAYLGCLNISLSPGALDAKPYRDFYTHHGLDEGTTGLVATQGHGYLRMVKPLPPTFLRVVAGDEIQIGGRKFHVLTGDGHAPEQIMLWCEADGVFLAADQVLAKITPNVSVWAVDPQGDPLGLYLRSLRAVRDTVPSTALVLPGHQLPFFGLHTRIAELIAHHEERCAVIRAACVSTPLSVADLVPVLFPRKLDPHQMSFAFSETLAHVNYMLRERQLLWADARGDVEQVRAAA